MEPKQINALESEGAFKALFQNATIGILVVGQMGKIELANPSSEALFGYTKSELIGQPLELLIPKNLRAKHTSHREGYFSNPKARPMGKEMELCAQKKDGKIFPVEISLAYYEFNGEKLAISFITDITERKRSVEALKQLNEDLEQRVADRTLELTNALEREKELSEMKTRFVSMASHEFRTPLSAVLSSVSLIQQYSKPDQEDKRKKHIDRIKSSVKNLTDILNNFLSVDKLEQGKVESEKTSFDLKEFADDVIEEVNNILKSGQVINSKHEGDRIILADKKFLRNVLLNLLSNASKYSEEHKAIELHSEVLDKKIRIKVKDNGIGIPQEEQKNLFGKFFRAKNAVNIQGTGLGLNIVKRYVELMEGTISFTSDASAGTVFIIEIPQNKI